MKEADIQKQILDYLAAERIFAFRLNSATFRVDSRFVRSHSLGPGAADILAFVQVGHVSMPVWIEVKRPGGKQSPEQLSFQARVEEAGHHYLVARSIEDVRDILPTAGPKAPESPKVPGLQL